MTAPRKSTRLIRSLFLMLLMALGWSSGAQKFIFPCIDDDCIDDGGGGSVTVNFTGPTSASVNDIDYYNVSVSGTSFYTTTYYVSGGTILLQSKSQVKVQWTTSGSKFVRATVSENGNTHIKTVYVSVSAPLVAGTISATTPTTICDAISTNPGIIEGSLPTGGTGSYSYQWQKYDENNGGGSQEPDGFDDPIDDPLPPTGGWVNIVGATSSMYNPPTIYSHNDFNGFRRKVTSGTATAYSNSIFYWFTDSPDAPVAQNEDILSGGDVTLQVDNGASGSYVWYLDRFQIVTPIDETTSSLVLPGISKSHEYWVAKGGTCESNRTQIVAYVIPQITFQNENNNLTNGPVVLIADGSHDSYSWKDVVGQEVGLGSSFVVSIPGEYHVEVTSNGLTTVSSSVSVGGMNSIVTKNFNESGEVIGKSAEYFDDGGRLLQSQSWDRETEAVFASEPIYDRYSRIVGSTMSAPTGLNEPNYKEDFVRTEANQPFDWQSFDTEATHYNPIKVGHQAGTLGEYYDGTQEGIDATDYPYSRSDFYEDGTGESKSSSGPGNEFRMGSGKENYSKILPVFDGELKYYDDIRDLILGFASGTTSTNNLVKTVVRDANEKYSVSYTDGAGSLIASALSADAYGMDYGQIPYIQLTVPFEPGIQTFKTQLHLSRFSELEMDYGGDPGSRNYFEATSLFNPNASNYAYEFNDGGFSQDDFGDVYDIEISLERCAQCELKFTLAYANYAYNFYDNRGRLVASIAPMGLEQILNSNSAPDSLDDLKFTTFYQYDFQGRLTKIIEPDAGETNYKYRKDGLIRFSQNAKQVGDKRFSYTDYDDLGRPVESGEFKSAKLDFGFMDDLDANNDVLIESENEPKFDVIKTTYDIACQYVDQSNTPLVDPSNPQKFIVGGVSYTENENVVSIYSYDDAGRVIWMRQYYKALDRLFITEYEYDFLGNVLKVAYQPQTEGTTNDEAFNHHYYYYKNSKLRHVYTSTSVGGTQYQHATYYYYEHGPLKQLRFRGGLQVIDYEYNLQGWLTKINDPSNPVDAPNHDSFALKLDYYTGGDSNSPAMYNGQIRSQEYRTGATGTPIKFKYKYDEKYQLIQSRTDDGTEQGDLSYGTDYSYDRNGNILNLERRKADESYEDDFRGANGADGYDYKPNTNQLETVYTDQSGNTYANYTYNAIGQLDSMIMDTDVWSYSYDVSGKVKEVLKDAVLQYSYEYDDRGFRIKKEYHVDTKPDVLYVRDASGNIMAIYQETSIGSDDFEPIEYPIYGSGRLGVYDKSSGTFKYELKDHLGNVRAVVADMGSGMEEQNRMDYYPFGFVMNQYLSNGEKYRFGYQGDFAEDDTEETGFNHFELREYDSRIGRWTATDPAGQFASPYNGMGNNPINGVDPDGAYLFGLFGSSSQQRHDARQLASIKGGEIHNIMSAKNIAVSWTAGTAYVGTNGTESGLIYGDMVQITKDFQIEKHVSLAEALAWNAYAGDVNAITLIREMGLREESFNLSLMGKRDRAGEKFFAFGIAAIATRGALSVSAPIYSGSSRAMGSLTAGLNSAYWNAGAIYNAGNLIGQRGAYLAARGIGVPLLLNKHTGKFGTKAFIELIHMSKQRYDYMYKMGTFGIQRGTGGQLPPLFDKQNGR